MTSGRRLSATDDQLFYDQYYGPSFLGVLSHCFLLTFLLGWPLKIPSASVGFLRGLVWAAFVLGAFVLLGANDREGLTRLLATSEYWVMMAAIAAGPPLAGWLRSLRRGART